MRFNSRWLIAPLVLLLAGLACTLSVRPTPPPVPTPVGQPTPPPFPTLAAPVVTDSEEQLLIDLYQRVNPSVVSINVDTAQGAASGSGFVYDTDGHIVTNAHVVQDATSIEVDFPSGFKARGTVAGIDLDSDLAVVKVEAPAAQLVPIPMGDSDQVLVGQRVVAIGNPFEYNGTMTIGIVSARGRTLRGLRTTSEGQSYSTPDILQTDAAINPGNSGGPLLNLKGEVIGVNKALESETGTNTGIGFAVASNTVKRVAPFLIADGKFVYPYLGISSISLPEMSLTAEESLGLKRTTGVYVTSVIVDSPSAHAGLTADSASETSARFNGDGDLIIAINGFEVKVYEDLMRYLVNNERPGDEVTLTLLRHGEQLDVKVTLGERP